MEATGVSLGKAALGGALGYATSKAAEEIALQIGVQRDVNFIKDELQMMQSFLMTADEAQNQNKVLTTWVKQIGVLAYKVEDSLMDFSLHSEKKPFLGCIPRKPGDRRRIAKEVKQLRAEVEDVSNRNLRYRLISESSGSKPSEAETQASITTAAMLGINEARLATLGHEKSSEADLHQLITSNDVNLRVIAVWATGGNLGETFAIQEVYDDPMVLKRFGLCAWIRLTHPFNPQEFVRSLVSQFYENSHDEVGKAEQETGIRADVMANMEKMDQRDLVSMFKAQLCSNSYLVVINGLSTIEEWHCIKKYFPNNKKWSRIVISTQQVEIARLCTEKPYQVSEFKQLSCDQTIYLFHKKNPEEQLSIDSVSGGAMVGTTKASFVDVEEKKLKADASYSADPISNSSIIISSTTKNTSMLTNEIMEEDQEPNNAGDEEVQNSIVRKKIDLSRTPELADEVLYGRETEKSFVIKLVGRPDNNQGCKVISVWGMGGLGKTTLVRSVYRSQQLGCWKHAWATAMRPFNPEVLLRDLVLQLQEGPAGSTSTAVQTMNLQKLNEELARVLEQKKCLVVIDDLWCNSEWDSIKQCLHSAGRIIVTTREKNIARHCSIEKENMYCLEGLKDVAALDLFKKKVFKKNIDNNNLSPAMMEQAILILQKCNGLPLAISTIGGFLATKLKTAIEWKKMSYGINTELEINPELRTMKSILMRSYDGLPYHLKSVFLYLSIFPEDYRIRWGRLVRRWIAEGYSRDMHGMTATELCQRYFDELLDRSMILPGEGTDQYSGKINSCQLHDMIREICISKAREENLVFTLEEGCCLSNTQGAIRHLVIGSNWKRDKNVLQSMLDLSHVRSLTVFGWWRSFFISDNMKFLRVLDLENSYDLRDHHLHKIVQVRHLKYLSLRGCRMIFNLPNSLGNLWHLETLDVRDTSVLWLPTTITNLQKLQHLCGDHLLLRTRVFDSCLNRFGLSNIYSASRGIGKLKALHTLGVLMFDGRNGDATIKEFRDLTQLRKLKVDGLYHGKITGFWSAIAGQSQLRSLSVTGHELDGCLGEGLLPPGSLESLTVMSALVHGTSWISKLQNLSKLVLERSKLVQEDAIQALGFLPNLAVLRLKDESFHGTELHFRRSSFPSLVVLHLSDLYYLQSVLFEEGASTELLQVSCLPKLELLQVDWCRVLSAFSGLPALKSLNEIRSNGLSENVKQGVLSQVAEHMQHVRVNLGC